MKRTYLIAILLGVTVSGCGKKDFTCKCDGGFSGQGMQRELKQTKKSAAKKACQSYENEPGTADGFTNCRLL